MMKFTDLQENKAGKNLHLEHLEDEIINFGVDGGRAAINFLSLQVLTQRMVSFLLQRNQFLMLIQNYIKQMQR